MAHFHNNALVGASGQGGYLINQSLRFNPTDSTYLNRTPASAGNQKTWTYSVWIKRSLLSSNIGIFMPVTGGDGFNECQMRFDSSDRLQVYDSGGAAGYLNVVTTRVFRDCSAWYHLVFVYDSTQATSSNRFKIYVNGTQETSFSTAQYPNQNNNSGWNGTSRHDIGRIAYASNQYFGGYLSESHMIDGTALTPSSFGETDTITGAWIPKKYSGSYGTNGFYLKFESSGIGTDSSGNGNTWTANNFSTSGTGTDVMSDTPTNNYATLNPLNQDSAFTLSNGNLQLTSTATTGSVGVTSTSAVSSGKWYWEATRDSWNINCGTGLITTASPRSSAVTGSGGKGVTYLGTNIYKDGSSVQSGLSQTVDGDVIGIALDLDSNTVQFYKNNSAIGTAVSISAETWTPSFGMDTGGYGANVTTTFNFGQRSFSYTPPTGFKALNTANLPEPTIKKGDKYFDTKLYTGTGGSQSLSGLGFQPDLVWIKARSTASSHGLYDAVRGVGQVLLSNSTSAEQNYGSYGVTSFNSAGFSVNDLPGYGVNDSGQTYVAWTWDANGAGSSNTAGSITSTVSANASAGFSIVTYTGTGAQGTLGHGLGVAPSFVIVRNRDQTANWLTYHSAYGLSHTTYPNWQYLNLTVGEQSSGSSVNHPFYQRPSSTVLYLNTGTSELTNVSGQKHIAYCFSEVAGYSKFGKYAGNSSSDGSFVFLGFRPAYLLIVGTTSGSWQIYDTKRMQFNPGGSSVSGLQLEANNATNPSGNMEIDLLSNGFKCRTSDSTVNFSGREYVYAAFSETAFKFANAR